MIKRNLKEIVVKTIKNWPIILLTGPRQVGKSTLCKQIADEFKYNYISFDNALIRIEAKANPYQFVRNLKLPVIIDEVQYVPEVFDEIECIVNEKRLKGNANGLFILTSSQRFDLMKNVTQSMAGRVCIIKMSTLSLSEILKRSETPFIIDNNKHIDRNNKYAITSDEINKYILRGFFPELYNNKDLDPTTFYSNYLETYIARDFSQLVNIKDKTKFINFIKIVASMTGQEIVYETIAKALVVSPNTIRSWISVLLSQNIITILNPYNDYSTLKQIVKKGKVYFLDTGLACYLLGINDINTLKQSNYYGHLFETYVYNEISKSYINGGLNETINFYRDNNQNEIDLIILNNGVINEIEIKSGQKYDIRDFKAFNLEISKKYPARKCIISSSNNYYTIAPDIFVYNISVI